jgi:hypothetical protein
MEDFIDLVHLTELLLLLATQRPSWLSSLFKVSEGKISANARLRRDGIFGESFVSILAVGLELLDRASTGFVAVGLERRLSRFVEESSPERRFALAVCPFLAT